MTQPQQGVVKEVVFPNGKQDSKATMEMGTLHGYPQVGPSEVWMVCWEYVPGAQPRRGNEGVLKLYFVAVTLPTTPLYRCSLILII